MYNAGQRSLNCSLNCSPQRLALVAVRAALVVTLTVLALVGAAAVPGYGQTPASSAPGPAGPSPTGSQVGPPPAAPERGRVVLRNASFTRVRVEVRAGPASDCGQNPLVGVEILTRGTAWGIGSDQPVCYRREEAEASDQATQALMGARTAWTRKVLTRGRVEELLL